jgi:hypothetical protein
MQEMGSEDVGVEVEEGNGEGKEGSPTGEGVWGKGRDTMVDGVVES